MKFLNTLKKGLIQFWFMLVDLLTDRPQGNETTRKISLGRCCFLVLFIASLSVWLAGADIAANMLIVMGSLLTYVFGSKITDGWAPSKKVVDPTIIVDPEEGGD